MVYDKENRTWKKFIMLDDKNFGDKLADYESETIDGKPYSEIVQIAREFIADLGGFEAFAEWGIF